MKLKELFRRLTDKEIREFLLKEEFKKYMLKKDNSYDYSALIISNVNEFHRLWISNPIYIITIKNINNNYIYEYNSKEKKLSLYLLNQKRISLDYIKENLNYLINLESLLNNFFAKEHTYIKYNENKY